MSAFLLRTVQIIEQIKRTSLGHNNGVIFVSSPDIADFEEHDRYIFFTVITTATTKKQKHEVPAAASSATWSFSDIFVSLC